ncbi:hypothetical protein X750_00055 [Mesorhizobium sp. LNJC394B00]|nr:hypothetical protein X752_20365 [Mesorhizobium sp. LNJC398B00]ESY25650.1 hypothetical protein X750_00055 [Mesorhizobium sp. LNJC394B00]
MLHVEKDEIAASGLQDVTDSRRGELGDERAELDPPVRN